MTPRGVIFIADGFVAADVLCMRAYGDRQVVSALHSDSQFD
ncbi:hypothetical protein ACQ4M4_23610 [Leptolyngbya sp. AN02str]